MYQHQKAGLFTGEKFIHKVPATDMEALTSPLMSLLEKNRCKNFFQFCVNWDPKDPLTHKGVCVLSIKCHPGRWEYYIMECLPSSYSQWE